MFKCGKCKKPLEFLKINNKNKSVFRCIKCRKKWLIDIEYTAS